MPQVAIPAAIAGGAAGLGAVATGAAFWTAASSAFVATAALSGLSQLLYDPPSAPSINGANTNRVQSGVQDAVYAYGTTDVPGVLAWHQRGDTPSYTFAKNSGRLLRMVLLLAEGPIEEIVGIKIAGELVEFQRHGNALYVTDDAYVHTERKRRPHIALGPFSFHRAGGVRDPYWFPTVAVTEFFAADGTRSVDLRDLPAGVVTRQNARSFLAAFADYDATNLRLPTYRGSEYSSPASTMQVEPDWEFGANHRLQGISYVVVDMLAPYKDDFDERPFRSIPRFEFVVKGAKVSYPLPDGTMSAPEYTANAAKLRAAWLIERRGVPARYIDRTYLDASIALCDQELDTSGLNLTEPTAVKQYELNGTFATSDSPAQIERAMNVAMDGIAPVYDGVHLIRAGGERQSRTTITGDDVLQGTDPLIRPAFDFARRLNSLTAVLQHSRRHDYTATTVTVDDTEAEQRDGERLTQSPVRLPFTTDPVQAEHLLRSNLAQARHPMTVQLAVRPRTDWSLFTLVPGDKVRLTLPEYGFVEREFMLMQNELRGDWEVLLDLHEWAADRFRATLSPLAVSVAPVTPVAHVPAPAAFTATYVTVLRDGVRTFIVQVSWASSPHRTRVDVTGAMTQTFDTAEDSVSFETTATGTFDIAAVHYSATLGSSASVSQSLVIAVQTVATPTHFGIETHHSQLRFSFVDDSLDVRGVELRYQRAALDSTTALTDIHTDAAWSAAERLDVVSVLPEVQEQPIIGTAHLPEPGRYALAARVIDAAGSVSEVLSLGTIIANFDVKRVWNFQSYPQFDGTHFRTYVWPHSPEVGNILLNSGLAANTITFEDWNGAGGYPFISDTGAFSYYQTPSMSLGGTFNVSISVSAEYFIPPGVTSTYRGQTQVIAEYETGTATEHTLADNASIIRNNVTGVRGEFDFRDIDVTGVTYFGVRRFGVHVREV